MSQSLLCLLVITIGPICLSAGFRNLDFQSPIINANFFPPNELVANIIPGWQLQIGRQLQQSMFYNNACISCPSAQLYGPEIPKRGDRFQFSMKTGDSLDAEIPISIFQRGDVPPNARSIQFIGLLSPDLGAWHISLGGQPLQVLEIDDAQLVTISGSYPAILYGADVSSWAGRTAELRFTAGPVPFSMAAGGVLADIHFSSTALPAIPEPSTWALLITGLAALAWNHLHRGRRQALNAGDFRPPRKDLEASAT